MNIPFGYSSEKMQKLEARVDKIQYDFKKLSTQSHSRFLVVGPECG